MTSMLVYYNVLLIILLLSWMLHINRIDVKVYLLFSFSTMAIPLGLRGVQTGEDTLHYLLLFQEFNKFTWKQLLSSGLWVVWEEEYGQSVEIGYAILNKMMGILSIDGQGMIAIVGCMTCFLCAKFIYDNLCDSSWMATLFILCDSFYMSCYNGIRQALATVIAANAYTFLRRKKYFFFILTFSLACLIHNTMLAFIPLAVLFMMKSNKSILLAFYFSILFVGGMLKVGPIVITHFLPRYTLYFENNWWDITPLHGTLILWILYLLLSVFIIEKGISSTEERFGIIACILYISCEILGQRIAAFGRISMIYRFFTIFLITSFLKRVEGQTKRIYIIGVFLLMICEYSSYIRVPSRAYSVFWNNAQLNV